MKKLPAYSIIELIVVMLIATIVVATAYQGYLLFFRQYLAFKDRCEKIAEVSLLDRLMLSDIENSRQVRKHGASLYCFHADKEVRYEFIDNAIIRHQSAVPDSFYLNTGQPEYHFIGQSASEGSLVDRINFSVEREKDSIHFIYEKKYGADVLLEAESQQKFLPASSNFGLPSSLF